MPQRRIVYVAPFDLRESAGHVSHVVATIRHMVDKGQDVTLLSAGCPDNISEIVHFVSVPIVDRRFVRSASFGIMGALLLLREIIVRRPRAVYTRYFTSVIFLTILSRTLFVPVVIEVNADLANERRASKRGRIAGAAERFENWLAFRCASAVVAVSAAIAESIAVIAPRRQNRYHIVENGVDTGIYSPRDRTECVARRSLNPNGKRIVFAGAFQLWQGVLDLVAATSILSRRRDDVELLLVGDGPLRSDIDAEVEKLGLGGLVRVTGYVSEEIVAEYICASDVCIAPYNFDSASESNDGKCEYGAHLRGSPLKIYTYLACGRPVVASFFREAGAYVQKEGAGVAVEPEEPAILADAIDRILSDPVEAKIMGDRARQIAEYKHDWSAVVDSYLEIVDSVTESG